MDLAEHSCFTNWGDYKSNQIQILVFDERGKPEYPGEKPLKAEYITKKQETQVRCRGQTWTRAILLEGKCPQRYANCALHRADFSNTKQG